MQNPNMFPSNLGNGSQFPIDNIMDFSRQNGGKQMVMPGNGAHFFHDGHPPPPGPPGPPGPPPPPGIVPMGPPNFMVDNFGQPIPMGPPGPPPPPPQMMQPTHLIHPGNGFSNGDGTTYYATTHNVLIQPTMPPNGNPMMKTRTNNGSNGPTNGGKQPQSLESSGSSSSPSLIFDHPLVGNGPNGGSFFDGQVNGQLKNQMNAMSICAQGAAERRSQNMTECVAVPSSEHVAEIVGKQGCKIKALRQSTNTYIKTPIRGENPIFVITGRPDDVNIAKKEILEAAEHFTQIRAQRRLHAPVVPGQVTEQMQVPLRLVGLIVGPKGQTIKRIQVDTQTYIVTPGRDKDPVFDITGSKDGVDRAKELIAEHILQRTGNTLEELLRQQAEQGLIAPQSMNFDIGLWNVEPDQNQGQNNNCFNGPIGEFIAEKTPIGTFSIQSAQTNNNQRCNGNVQNGAGGSNGSGANISFVQHQMQLQQQQQYHIQQNPHLMQQAQAQVNAMLNSNQSSSVSGNGNGNGGGSGGSTTTTSSSQNQQQQSSATSSSGSETNGKMLLIDEM